MAMLLKESQIELIESLIQQDEAGRLAERRKIKAQLAEACQKDERSREIVKLLGNLARREDQAVEAHGQACQPLQIKLLDMDAEIMAAVENDLPTPNKAGKQRADILAQIAGKNSILDAEVSAIKLMRFRLEKEKESLSKYHDLADTLRGELGSRRLAKKEWQVERAITLVRIRQMTSQLSDAEDASQRIEQSFNELHSTVEQIEASGAAAPDDILESLRGRAYEVYENIGYRDWLRSEVAALNSKRDELRERIVSE